MKFIIIFASMLFCSQAFALCPIDGGESVCSLPGFREQVSPIYHENSGILNLPQPNIELQPLKREDPMAQMRSPINKLNYNSSCQFGVCLQDEKTPSDLQPNR